MYLSYTSFRPLQSFLMSVLSHDFVQANLAPYLSAASFNLLVRTSKQIKLGFEQVLQDRIMSIEGGRLSYLKLVDEFKQLGDATRKIDENPITWEVERETWSIDFIVPHYWMNGKSTENGKRTVFVTWESGNSLLEIAFSDSCCFREFVASEDGEVEDEEYYENDDGNFVHWLLQPSETGFVWADEKVKPYQGWEFWEFQDLWSLIACGEIATLPYDEAKISWR